MILGFAGASFAVALPLASRWYPAEHQGKAMGIAGMGNSGTVLAALFAPILANLFGWNAVMGLAVIPLAVVFVVYHVMAKDSPRPARAQVARGLCRVLKDEDAWWFMLFYSSPSAASSACRTRCRFWFVDSFALTPVTAGYYTAACVFTGSLLRPLGGALADRFGGTLTLTWFYIVARAGAGDDQHRPGRAADHVLAVHGVMGTLGIGNGAVFQLVPQRFGSEIGVMTGLVGAGGVGGFSSPVLGLAREVHRHVLGGLPDPDRGRRRRHPCCSAR